MQAEFPGGCSENGYFLQNDFPKVIFLHSGKQRITARYPNGAMEPRNFPSEAD